MCYHITRRCEGRLGASDGRWGEDGGGGRRAFTSSAAVGLCLHFSFHGHWTQCLLKSLKTASYRNSGEGVANRLAHGCCPPGRGDCGGGSQNQCGNQPTRAPEFSSKGNVIGTLPVASSLGRKPGEGKTVQPAVWSPAPCGSGAPPPGCSLGGRWDTAFQLRAAGGLGVARASECQIGIFLHAPWKIGGALPQKTKVEPARSHEPRAFAEARPPGAAP